VPPKPLSFETLLGGSAIRFLGSVFATRGGYRASSARLDRARAGSLRERAGSTRLVKQPSQRISSARLVCELELARLAREPEQKNSIHVYIQ
jgi:hypothetical protein